MRSYLTFRTPPSPQVPTISGTRKTPARVRVASLILSPVGGSVKAVAGSLTFVGYCLKLEHFGGLKELFTATQLPNGNYFLAICAQPARFITLNKNGEKISEQNYDLQMAKNHAQFRQVTPTSNKTIIIPVLGKGEIIEIDENNNLLRQIKVDGNLFSVKILPDKNWLVACGDAHKFVIIDPKKEKIIKSYTDGNVKECSLNFVAEPHLLKNGNFLIANWNGHAKDKTQPKIIEIDKNGKVVWTLPHNEKIINISTIDLL